MTFPDSEDPVDPAAENVVDELVDLFNAGDLDSLGELLHPDVTSDFWEKQGRAGILEGIAELVLRNPGLILTRGELGTRPVVVAWEPGPERTYRRMGYFVFAFSEGGEEPVIDHIDYDDRDVDEGSLLAEEPDPADMPEGYEWSEWDAGEV